MKRLICFFLACMMAVPLCACSADTNKKSDRLQVVCTLFPYYDFAREIGGEDVDVSLLVPAGKETHSFEPTPLDVIRVSKADVFLYNGGESEQWVENILSAAGEDIAVTAAMMDLVDLQGEETVEGMQVGKQADEDSDEIEYDEHIWTSPVIAQDICWGICGALCKADREHAKNYISRAEAYTAQLARLDEAFRDVVENGQRNILVFGDRFPLLYFCQTYGLSYRAAFHGCSSDTEPSLTTLKYLIDKVSSEEIPVVYTIELSNQKVAQAIAETTGAQVRTFHSCQTISRADFNAGTTYLDLMRQNLDVLKEGLC